MFYVHLQFPPLETIVSSSEDCVSKRRYFTWTLKPQPQSNLVLSFPGNPLLGCCQVLFKTIEIISIITTEHSSLGLVFWSN